SVVLAQGKTILHNVPQVSDTRIKARLLERFGAKIEWQGSTLILDCSELKSGEADEDTVRSIRTSFYLLGPLVARLGTVVLPAPGGCKIGARPVDFHLKGLRAMGATIDIKAGCYEARCKQLHGADIYLDFPSAGATQHLMATAALADGVTTIENAAMEPEVESLGQFLNSLGARVEGHGNNTVTITGRPELAGGNFRVPADRIQAGTYLLAGVMTGGCVRVNGVNPSHQTAVVNKLRETGVIVRDHDHEAIDAEAIGPVKGIRVKTMPYPGFPTDMQQPMSALLALANGPSLIEETVYESRTGHISELNRMGARMRAEGKSTIIEGVSKLTGATVEASDLRAGAALVLAGLAAEGTTYVRNIHFIDRGYEDLEATIRSLGGDIERVPFESRGPVGYVGHDQA
ncbi:MAG: UDP-N-acetylglucosamine 1-carboxyvinyltransferase, partial [Armatimonadota bacterium]